MKLPAQVHTAFDLLEKAGFEAFLVGGAVRNFIRNGSAAEDWDITTNALPEQVKEVFSAYRLIETGLKHGTVTVMMDHVPLEITTYRIDGDYSDNRHPDSVRFTRNLKDDLERRDFTMNALAYHPKTGVVDLVGGCEDIRSGLVRCVGDPDRRFREDGLRMLRALRFASTLGMTIEGSTAEAIHRNCHLLSNIAPERIRVELDKLLCGKAVRDILTRFADVLTVPIPEIIPMFGFDQRNPHHDKDIWLHTAAVVESAPADPVLRWAALLHDVGKPSCFSVGDDGVGHFYGHAEQSTALSAEILTRLRFDNTRRERILRLVRYHDLPIVADRKIVKRLMNKHGTEAVHQLIDLHIADNRGQSALCADRIAHYEAVRSVVEGILSEEACFSLKDLAVNGNDLLELGFRGKAVGELLRSCLGAVMDEQVPNRREELLAHIDKHTPDFSPVCEANYPEGSFPHEDGYLL